MNPDASGYGFWVDEWTSGKVRHAHHTARVTFPLTPGLSLAERENPALPFSRTHRGVCPTNLPHNRTCRRLFPLPPGERVRVKRIALRV